MPSKKTTPPKETRPPVDPELLAAVRSLNADVKQLHNIFVKRTVLWWVLGSETVLVVIALIAVFVLSTNNHTATNRLVNKLVESCQTRQKQISGTNHFILDIERLQTESYKHIPKQFQTPEQVKLEHQYTQALNRWKHSQPKATSCEKLR